MNRKIQTLYIVTQHLHYTFLTQQIEMNGLQTKKHFLRRRYLLNWSRTYSFLTVMSPLVP